MGIGQVASHEDLVRLHLLEQLSHDIDIFLRHRQLLDASALIERQVEEVYVVERNVVVGACRAGFAAADEPLDVAHVERVDVTLFLFGQELLDVLIHFLDDLILVANEDLVESIDEMHEAGHFLVVDGNVSTCLISYMQVVALFDQSLNGSTHRDNVVVGVG